MSLNLEQKKVIVGEIAEVAAQAPSAIAAEYIGLSVADMTKLRQQAREAGIYLRVVRNTLARRALEDTKFDCMRDELVGPLLLAFSNEEPGSAARVIRDFAKDNEKLVAKLVSLDGKLLAANDLDRLASMPTLDQARAMLLGLLQAPATTFVRVLAEPEGKFVRLLAAYRDQQKAA
ncbi:MAG: 50S ribosomal protein L10 [Gammaproteobacteria bacterium]|nr:50S ribosomal protein L10 [Gammaproteobacteria bacterium]